MYFRKNDTKILFYIHILDVKRILSLKFQRKILCLRPSN
jgi:hypothetical protein